MSFSVVIVEDESILRQGIVCLPPWKGMDCAVTGNFSNAIDALEFIEHNPTDIVITDIVMPRMSGLELCRAVKDRFPKTKVIVLTAFEEFSYAQEALRSGASDYIIKADFLKKLPEAVRNATEQLSALQHRSFDRQLAALILESVLSGNALNMNLVETLSRDLHINLNDCYVAVSEITGESEDVDTKQIEQLYDLVFQEYPHLSFWSEENLLVSLIGEITCKETLEELCKKCIHGVSHLSHNSVQMGISSLPHESNTLSQQYQDALNALSICCKANSISPSYGPAHSDESVLLDQSGFRQMLNNMKTLYETEPFPELIQSISLLFSETGSLPFSTLSNFVKYLCIELIISGSAQFQKEEKNLLDNMLKNFETCYSRYSLQSQFEQFLHEGLSSPVDSSKNLIITKVKEYIHENYKNAFKLDNLAAYVHMNSSYLSRAYKKLTGESIVTSLNRYRVRVAKKLLLSDTLIKDVALQVGIPDPAYFTVVFTKHAGISPKEYQLSNKS